MIPIRLNGVDGYGSKKHYKNLSIQLNFREQESQISSMESLFLEDFQL